jgi:hypothetical protein
LSELPVIERFILIQNLVRIATDLKLPGKQYYVPWVPDGICFMPTRRSFLNIQGVIDMKSILIPTLVLGALASVAQAAPVSLNDAKLDRVTAGSIGTFGATTFAATTVKATTLGATTFAATTVKATTLGATTLRATTLGATTRGATTLGATTLGATTLGATTLGGVVIRK